MPGETAKFGAGAEGVGNVLQLPVEVVRHLGSVSAGADARPVDHLTEAAAINEVTTCRQAAELPGATVPGEGKVIPLEPGIDIILPEAA